MGTPVSRLPRGLRIAAHSNKHRSPYLRGEEGKNHRMRAELFPTFWSVSASDLLQRLQASPQGLTSQEAQRRLARARANLLKPAKRTDALTLLLAQFKSPIVLILLFAAGLSLCLHGQ